MPRDSAAACKLLLHHPVWHVRAGGFITWRTEAFLHFLCMRPSLWRQRQAPMATLVHQGQSRVPDCKVAGGPERPEKDSALTPTLLPVGSSGSSSFFTPSFFKRGKKTTVNKISLQRRRKRFPPPPSYPVVLRLLAGGG